MDLNGSFGASKALSDEYEPVSSRPTSLSFTLHADSATQREPRFG